MYKHYTPEEYPKYDNYDAINVNTYTEIPCDYDGVMGVPITFWTNIIQINLRLLVVENYADIRMMEEVVWNRKYWIMGKVKVPIFTYSNS